MIESLGHLRAPDPERATPWNSKIASAVAVGALSLMVLAEFHGFQRRDRIDTALARSDFGAFYCAAKVLRTHGDPYKLAPLAACESHSVFEPGGLTLRSQGIDPAPLPPYALAAFVPFTYLSYRNAGVAWLGLLLVALCASAAALRRLTSLPFAVALAALAYGDGAICLAYGQEQPLVTLGLTGAGIALVAKRDGLAVLFAAIAFLEPQVGLPTMFALALFSRARRTAAGTIAALGVLSLVVAGWQTNLEYIKSVLPAHAFSELGIGIQYSLAAVLFAARVPDALALHLAALQYILIAGAGARFVSRRVRRRRRDVHAYSRNCERAAVRALRVRARPALSSAGGSDARASRVALADADIAERPHLRRDRLARSGMADLARRNVIAQERARTLHGGNVPRYFAPHDVDAEFLNAKPGAAGRGRCSALRPDARVDGARKRMA